MTCSVKLLRGFIHSSCDPNFIPFQSEMLSDTTLGMPKNLFSDLEPRSTQDNIEELLGLCSGQFIGSCHQVYNETSEGHTAWLAGTEECLAVG